MALKLFRRHRSTCTQGYKKEDRIFETDSPRSKGERKRAQCDCSIFAEGTHEDGGYQVQKSTGKNDWKEARLVTERWERERKGAAEKALAQAAIEEPNPEPTPQLPEGLISVSSAVDDFLKVIAGNGTADGRMQAYQSH